ncbi:MAG: threonine synthase [Dethiobacter sp.]|nr:threonine synthase [Dethiobacter sp.]MBS3901876.1 threonine synthase [Dethiobacter sp.]MBS3988935.1 threonine synthase [Dethiobacter sp.]
MAQLIYHSTRGDDLAVTAAEAILSGIAADGGLYVPAEIPLLTTPLHELAQLDYQQLAVSVLRLFLTDFTEEELREAVAAAYNNRFDTAEIAPVVEHGGVRYLELFHGPTLAFKDMALALLPYLMKLAARKTGLDKEVVILTATSGDTGKAALEAFAGVEGTRIIVFFPEQGVSPVQKQQMVTQAGNNTFVIGIEGNFDDAQSGVKQLFTDRKLLDAMAGKDLVFSSANSINIGRLIPQVVYYWHAYLRVMADGGVQAGEPLDFAVPTGNFGNILAGYYAKMMGLPVGTLICASNENRVLSDFFASGVYNKEREFYLTSSPSMDILVSSNLERLLWQICGKSSAQVTDLMQQLASLGRYQISEAMKRNLTDFVGGHATEEETSQAIRQVHETAGYLLDPHTAVAYNVWEKYRQKTGSKTPAVVVSTASPYKFTKDVMQALNPQYADGEDFALFAEMEKITAVPVPAVVRGLASRPVLHKRVCKKAEMQLVVESILGL